jgi:hypothetical protein
VKPGVNICKFTYHPDPQNRPSVLHHNIGSESQGFVRGSDLKVGQVLVLVSKNGKSVWVGSLTEKFNDANYGDGWAFTVRCVSYLPSTDQTPEEVTATVINPTAPAASSDPFTADPKPDDVP